VAELQLPLGTIVLSLPVAITVGDMIASSSLEPLPRALAWGALLALWQTVSQPEFRAGTADFLVDALNLPDPVRRQLRLDRRPAVARPPVPPGLVAGVLADVAAWRGAIDARRGGGAPPAPVGAPAPASAPANTWPRPAAATPAEAADLDAIDAAVDHAAEAGIGLPVVHLDAVAAVDNLWVVGPKGSGKTTVLRALIAHRPGVHIALDPHNTPGKWPSCTVVGGGRNFAAIELGLAKGIGRMDARYKAMDRGEITEAACKARPFTLVGDEWLAITEALPGRRATRDAEADPSAADQLLTLLTEGRKAGLRVMAASHADTATAMGLSGKKDVLKCFDLVVYLGAIAVERVPAAAAMHRPAVVYDPERGAYAQLLIGPVGAAPAPDPAPAAEVEPPVPPATGTTQHLSLSEAELVELMHMQAATAARVVAAAPPRRTDVVSMTVPTPVAATRPTGERLPAPADDLLSGLLASDPGPAASPKTSNLDAQIRAALAADAPPASPPPAQHTLTLDGDGRHLTIHNTVIAAPATQRRAALRRGLTARQRRERAGDYQKVKQVIAAGGSANQAQQEAGIKRERALALARQARAEIAGSERGNQGGSGSQE
jgi:hypothetical protein